MIYRLSLLALLPLITLGIYLKGQKYEPSLIDFRSFSTTNGSSFLPHEVDGFYKSGQTKIYSKENLYEHMNGHAEYFISAGFRSLSVGEYVKSETESSKPSLLAEIYDMGKDIYAFGVLVDEVGEKTKEVTIGMMGFETSQGISFVKGKYYIKISQFRKEVPLFRLAKGIENKIGVDSDSFPLFSRFPDLGKVISTRFIKDGYRGLDFMHDVVEREYLLDGKNIQVFLVTGVEKEMNKLTTSLLDHFKKYNIPCESVEKYEKRFYKVMDPYEGDWYMIPARDALFGIYGSVNDHLVRNLN